MASFEVSTDNYANTILNVKKIQRILKAVERGNFAFYPINTAMGFAIGFQVANPNTKEALLAFKESQLSEDYDFSRISKYFMQSENIERAKSRSISIVNNRGYYTY